MGNLPARRPAETTAATAALALLLGYALGIDNPAVLVAAASVIGAVPGVVTWLVELSRKNGQPTTLAPPPK